MLNLDLKAKQMRSSNRPCKSIVMPLSEHYFAGNGHWFPEHDFRAKEVPLLLSTFWVRLHNSPHAAQLLHMLVQAAYKFDQPTYTVKQ